MIKKFFLEEFGYEVEIGKYANQADGAVWLKKGGTVVLSTVVSAPSKEFPGFLPLTVDYRENFSAAGKIPGGYYKREGKFTDKEILTARLIDRAIRPLFPSKFFDQIQAMSTVYSVDKKNMPNTLALLSTSLALVISKIPFIEPVGVIEVGRIDGKWVFAPDYDQSLHSDVKLIIAGTQEGICMLEGNANSISEKDLLDIIFLAHEKIKKQVEWQKKIQEEVGIAKELNSLDSFDWKSWEDKADNYLTLDRLKIICKANKIERSNAITQLKDEFFALIAKDIENIDISTKDEFINKVDYSFETIFKSKITDLIFAQGKRVDGRAFDEVRKISVEVGLLPFTHGSALFNRGGTQALVSATLGSGQDVQKVEELMDDSIDKTFMLHYNFPPFSAGEVRAMRGPGRREIGHGYLAASAIKQQLPSQESFPYTIRVVSDILASDGSTSMATTCGATMALMNAGVPIKKMVSGVAMGLLRNAQGKFQALTDIAGFEDEFGWMDFKVTGTDDGVTAIQMDIKYKGGLPKEVFEMALAQAKKGRDHILQEMRKVMSAPNPELSSLVPKIISFKVDVDKIGAIIGGGGKTIREIIDKTKTTIDIEDDGTVKIFGGPEANSDLAVAWVKTLAGQIKIGSVYKGKVKRVAEFGLFVELVPGQDGLVHISSLPKKDHKNLAEVYKVGTEVTVEVIDYDPTTERIRLRLVTEPSNI